MFFRRTVFLLLFSITHGQKHFSEAITKTSPKSSPQISVHEKRRDDFFKKVHNVPIQDEHAMQLYQHWVEQAFSNFMAVVANQKLKQFEKPVHNEFGDCSKRAKTVPMHAKCLSDLFNGKINGAKFFKEAENKMMRFDRYRMKKRMKLQQSLVRGQSIKKRQVRNKWVGGFRMMDSTIPMDDDHFHSSERFNRYAAHRRIRRQSGIMKKNYYELLMPTRSSGRLSPMGKIAQNIMKKVLKSKGKQEDRIVPWQKTIDRIQNSARQRKAIKKMLENDEVENMDQLTYRGLKKQGLIDGQEEEEIDVYEILKDPKKLRGLLETKRKEKANQKGKERLERFVSLVREGIKLGYAFAGKNSSGLDDKTLKMVSPRFLSVTPEEDPDHNNTIDFLSPSLFSIHAGGKGIENLTSIPSLLKSVGGGLMGFSAQDQQMWLDLIIEASGVIEDVEKLEDELNNTAPGEDPLKTVWSKHFDKERYEREIRTKDGTPLYFTKQNISDAYNAEEVEKVDLFESFQKMISKDQVIDMNNTGYAMLSKQQMDLIYGHNSPYSDPEVYAKFTSLNKSQLVTYIEKDIHALAQIKSLKITRKEIVQPTIGANSSFPTEIGTNHNRSKRAVVLSPIAFSPFILTPINLNPIILSPIIFSPLILSPAVLGPVILSPWMFVPLVLSPRVLSPLVLSPPIFAPVILTPLALHPVILSPGVFVPFVLSPFVLTPFILSPQVFTPLILSPFALSPFILNPGVGIPIVLSPFVLSPIIWSPQFLGALVLSPYALSPIIQSPLYAYSLILSPSWLS